MHCQFFVCGISLFFAPDVEFSAYILYIACPFLIKKKKKKTLEGFSQRGTAASLKA